jgi:two-component system sensor histidine kinase KdpD
MFVMYFAIAIVTGVLTTRIRLRESAVRKNEEQIKSVYRFTKEIGEAAGLDETVRVAVEEMGRIFGARSAFLLATNGGLAERPHPAGRLEIGDREYAVALFSFEKRKPAGRFTDTLPVAENLYIPLKTANGPVGVMGLRFPETEVMQFETRIRLEAFASQIASALEREIANRRTEELRIHSESERLYKNLLNSVSHELRTPIAAIKGAASALSLTEARSSAETVRKLSDEIVSASDHLNLIIENLLDMSRIESGKVALKLDWHDVSDLLNVTVNRLRKYIGNREVVMDIDPDLPLTKLDFVVMEQVLSNLLMNAAKYSPEGSRIRLAARTEGEEMLILVQDRGPGIPVGQLGRIFDKFYRIQGSPGGGAGLGLSICKGLVEAHGGTITAENRATGGARFIVRLPLARP